MHAVVKEQIESLQFDLLKTFSNLSHGVFTKRRGLTSDPLDLNIQHHAQEHPAHKNFVKACQAYELKNPVFATQKHESNIVVIHEDNRSQSFECDGFITNLKEVALAIKHADCQAALFYDPTREVIGNVHCGWRGNVLNIYSKTVELLNQVFGCDPKNILVCISPSLGPYRAEFIHYQEELPKSFWPYKNNHDCFDFWKISEMQLENAGILKKNIEMARLCTYEQKELFFSYRRRDQMERNLTFISLS